MEFCLKTKICHCVEIIQKRRSSSVYQLQSKREIYVSCDKNRDNSYLRGRNRWMATSTSSRRSLKKQTYYHHANFFTRFKKSCNYGRRFWSDFVQFGWEEVGIRRKSESSLCPNQVHFLWIIDWWKRRSQVAAFLNFWGHENGWILSPSLEERREKWQ